MRKAGPGDGVEGGRRLALVVRPPLNLIDAITRHADEGRAQAGDHPLPLSPPHLTLLYLPCRLMDRWRFRRMVGVLRASVPFPLLYGGCTISDYLTIQMNVEPRAQIRQLHADLIRALDLVEAEGASAAALLEIFGTTNIGPAFSPHVTLGRYHSRRQAEVALRCFDGLEEIKQTAPEIWIADATGPLDHRLAIKPGARAIHPLDAQHPAVRRTPLRCPPA